MRSNSRTVDNLETAHFHVERIIDFVSKALPLCALHQTRTILFFAYVFVGLLEFLLYPPYSTGNTPFTIMTLFTPILIVVVLHIILTICYLFGALFQRASCVTGLALLYLLHAPLALVFLIGGAVILSQSSSETYQFDLSLVSTIAVFLDFLCGFVTRRYNLIPLSLELLALFPAGILSCLYFKDIVRAVWLPFLPPFIYFALYFGLLIFLAPQCGHWRDFMFRLFVDHSINAETELSFTPGVGDSNQQNDIPEPKRTHRASAGDYHESNDLVDTEVARFRADDWKVYSVLPQTDIPIYLASPLPILMFAVFLGICFVHVMSPICDFYFWSAGALLLVVLAVLLNSRATACAFLAFTNLDEKCLDVMWDHPSLSIL